MSGRYLLDEVSRPRIFAAGVMITTAALWRVLVPGFLIKQKSTEILMQKYSARLGADERTLVRRWRLCVLAFYGSITAAVLLLSILADRSTQIAGNTERPDAAKVTASR
jgi:hypothetical protein